MSTRTLRQSSMQHPSAAAALWDLPRRLMTLVGGWAVLSLSLSASWSSMAQQPAYGAAANGRDEKAVEEALQGWWTASMKTHDQRIAWWRESEFGCFIHWGVYSTFGGEWKGKPFRGYAEHMMWGFQKGKSALMVIVETPDDAAYQFSHPAGGPTVIGPRWRAQLGRFGYLRKARMCFIGDGNYVDLAKRYRRYVMKEEHDSYPGDG